MILFRGEDATDTFLIRYSRTGLFLETLLRLHFEKLHLTWSRFCPPALGLVFYFGLLMEWKNVDGPHFKMAPSARQ